MRKEDQRPLIKVLFGPHGNSDRENLSCIIHHAGEYLEDFSNKILIVVELAQMSEEGSRRIYENVFNGASITKSFYEEVRSLLRLDGKDDDENISDWLGRTCSGGNAKYVGLLVDEIERLNNLFPGRVLFLTEGASENPEEMMERFFAVQSIPYEIRQDFLYRHDLNQGVDWLRKSLKSTLPDRIKREQVMSQHIEEIIRSNKQIGLVVGQFGAVHTTLTSFLHKQFRDGEVMIEQQFSAELPIIFSPRATLERELVFQALKGDIDTDNAETINELVESVSRLSLMRAFVSQMLIENLKRRLDYELYKGTFNMVQLMEAIYQQMKQISSEQEMQEVATGWQALNLLEGKIAQNLCKGS